MKKRYLALALVLLLFMPRGTPAEETGRERNFYEIFVASFSDSDGDGMGDLNGVTEKLDYIADLGMNGLWLMPIMPSPSYHKYDVADYYAIDPAYGTLEDFEALLAAAHARDMVVLVDLVLNHTSREHPFFQSALDKDSPYRAFYSFSDTPRAGFGKTGDLYYECRFADTMPDLNLDHPEVRAELARVIEFWLNLGVDGFRLDACTSYYTGAKQKNIDFLRWVKETARSVNPACYLVGECWESAAEIADYYQSGLDAFFWFPAAQQDGFVAKALRNTAKTPGKTYFSGLSALSSAALGAQAAPFLDNHDTGRAASFLARDARKIKLAAGLLSIMPGSVFVYYGDEIGMVGAGADPNKRIPMNWGDAPLTQTPPGADQPNYPLGSAAGQMAEADSILRYYQKAMRLRLSHPAILRGTVREIAQPDDFLCLMARETEGETLYLAVNFSPEESVLALPAELSGAALCDQLTAAGEITLTDGTLRLPGYGIAYLR